MLHTCLVVDDDAAVRTYIESILTPRQYGILHAEDGVKALGLAQELGEALDLIVTDLEMPGGDGLTFIRSLRISYPAIPVILISGTALFDCSDQPGSLCEFLAKPFSPQMLLAALDRVTEGS